MSDLIRNLKCFDNFWAWYMLSIILGVILLYQNIKKEWKKLRVEKKICYSDDTSFQYRKIWFFQNALKILFLMFAIVLVFNVFLVDETDFESTLTLTQKIRNIVPVLVFYLSISLFQKVSVKENSNQILDKLIVLILKYKSEKLVNLIEKEICYINQQNKKIIHKISQSYLNGYDEKENEGCEQGRTNKKLLYILLEFSACDEFESKHKYEVKAFQSDVKQQEFLDRVISIRASLVGEKPYFSDKEFDYLCTGILPEIGISYSDIYITIKRISKYKNEIINRDVRMRDLYFQDKFIRNDESNIEITNDLFDKEIEAVFHSDREEEESLCITVNNH